uniref:TadF n=2 Tax=Aggregatibacter actinomycetemcomitans TaxID=714 RepID=Q7X0L3_AGGAC|nr:TadF [Aggregatibacter actinomycetemcomitans]
MVNHRYKNMKKNIITSIKKFFRNKKGAVTLELLFMLILLIFIFAFLTDLVIVRTTQGKLDNASYSLVNILRERNQLYNDNGTEKLKSTDLTEYEKMAKLILFGDKDSPNKVGVTIEHWEEKKTPEMLTNLGTCQPYRKLDDNLSYLSPRSESANPDNQRKIPLYQVTLCVEVGSFFKNLITRKENQSFGMLSSSSLAVAR